jgi:hypothetical protein
MIQTFHTGIQSSNLEISEGNGIEVERLSRVSWSCDCTEIKLNNKFKTVE